MTHPSDTQAPKPGWYENFYPVALKYGALITRNKSEFDLHYLQSNQLNALSQKLGALKQQLQTDYIACIQQLCQEEHGLSSLLTTDSLQELIEPVSLSLKHQVDRLVLSDVRPEILREWLLELTSSKSPKNKKTQDPDSISGPCQDEVSAESLTDDESGECL